MQLYVGSGAQFIRDSIQNQITDRLREAFFRYYGHRPSPSEAHSWTNSLRAMSQVIQYGGFGSSGVILEYQLPLSSCRIDCLLTGHTEGARVARAVLVELKQWERCDPSNGEHILTWLGGGRRDVLHPSVQVDQYRQYLADGHTAFYEEPAVGLDACAYLHNYTFLPGDPLEDARFDEVRTRAPVFSKDDVDPLVGYLQERILNGDDGRVLDRIQSGRYRPSRKLMKHVADVIKREARYVLLDELLVVRDRILSLLDDAEDSGKKQVLIVKGGPGTGKSAIAMQVMAELLRRGKIAQYATGSQAFNAALGKVIGTRGRPLFKSFYSYGKTLREPIDIIIADEAHRLREDNNLRWTPAAERTDLPQTDLLLKAARGVVFFIDDHQSVTPKDVGSVESIRDAASRHGANVREYVLDVQFRCGGADAFIQWVDNTLDIQRSATVLWEPNPDFEFRLFDDIHALDAAIAQKQKEKHDARLVAGYCWPWSDPLPDGTLVDDIEVGEFRRPWNARSNAGTLAPDIPPERLWAYDPRGARQVGCVYTAQGFEFDYVGVIIGPDLRYDAASARWTADPRSSKDSTVKKAGERFEDLVKRTYRVLMTRGMRGCFVFSEDEATRNFLRSRMRQN